MKHFCFIGKLRIGILFLLKTLNMKKLLLLLITLALTTATLFGQFSWDVDFDNPSYLDRITLDTVNNHSCKWQIGQPNKTVFASSKSVPNSIVTDTLNPIPPNDTSTFYLKHLRDNWAPHHIFYLQFWFQLDGDSTDTGKVEVSPDNGLNWIDILAQDTTYHLNWMSPKPNLSGSTFGWQLFSVNMTEWASNMATFPIAVTADTIIFRFTYITGGDSTVRDGWIIDDFHLEDWWEGIAEIQKENLISISPNPTSDELRIHRSGEIQKSRVQIINYAGQVVYDNSNFNAETINTRPLPPGNYLLKYSDKQYFTIKKFVVQR